MSAFPMMTIDLTFPTDWGRGRLLGGPVDGGIIGSPFAAVDDSVFHTASNPHSGQDFPVHEGFPVQEQRGGKVRAYGWDDNAGWWISILYPEGWNSFYCHLRQQPVGFNAGQDVAAGTVVGFVGSTGRMTTGPHLHWTLNTADGRIVDPMAYVGASGLDFVAATPAPPPAPPADIPDALPAPWVDIQTVNVGDIRIAIEAAARALVDAHKLAGGDGQIVRGN